MKYYTFLLRSLFYGPFFLHVEKEDKKKRKKIIKMEREKAEGYKNVSAADNNNRRIEERNSKYIAKYI